MSRKAYLYMRFSSAEQAKGDSLRRQRMLADEYVARHPAADIEIVEDEQFVDEGVSSYAGQNRLPGRALHRFLECVETGVVAPGSILMMESLDRLSRQQVIQAQRLLLDILLAGITVITTAPTETREYNGKAGLQDLIISLAGMERANQESALKSDRVRRAWKKKKDNADTVKVTSRGPSWLTLSADRKTFVVVEEKAMIVRRIFDLAITLGYQSIVKLLNSEAVPPLVKGSTGWHESSVQKLLTSQATIGIYQPHKLDHNTGAPKRVPDGEPIADYYPSIVDNELYYRIQAIKSSRRTGGAGRKGKTYTNLFGGLAKCSECGAPMVVVDKGAPPKGGKYFVCSVARRGWGCVYRAVPYKGCESGFMLYCQQVDLSEILPGANNETEATRLRKEISALQGERQDKISLSDRILESVEANGGVMPKAVQQRLVEYEARIDHIQIELDDRKNRLSTLATNSYRIAGMRDSFTQVIHQLRKARDGELYVLRAKLNDVLKTAIDSIEIGRTAPPLVATLQQLAFDSSNNFKEHHSEYIARMLKLGLKERGPLKEPFTTFKVNYRNGNTYELFLDKSGGVAGRHVFTENAKAEYGARGENRIGDRIFLTPGYSAYDEPKPARPRSKDGKFSAAKA